MPVRRITVTESFVENVAFDGAKPVLTPRRAR